MILPLGHVKGHGESIGCCFIVRVYSDGLVLKFYHHIFLEGQAVRHHVFNGVFVGLITGGIRHFACDGVGHALAYIRADGIILLCDGWIIRLYHHAGSGNRRCQGADAAIAFFDLRSTLRIDQIIAQRQVFKR